MEENIIFRLFGLVLTAYIFLSIAAICKLRELRRIKEEASRRIKPSEYDLWSYLLGAQKELKIPKQYCLDKENDRAVVAKIIEQYKIDLSTEYFGDRFHAPKAKGELTAKDSFMISFYKYLNKAYTASYDGYFRFNVHEIYSDIYSLQEAVERDEIDGKISHSGRSKYDIYDLQKQRSECFELIYCKVHLITSLYCKNCAILNEHWEESVDRNLRYEIEKRTS